MDEHRSSIELRLPSRPGFEKVAMNTAASVADLMALSSEHIEDLKTAIAEAWLDAVDHGNKLDETLVVIFSMGRTLSK
jgi:serine/threonine-protein kinase RsbW